MTQFRNMIVMMTKDQRENPNKLKPIVLKALIGSMGESYLI